MAITTNNLISRHTANSNSGNSITFSNIPQTFTDLRLVASIRGTNTTPVYTGVTIAFNGTSTTTDWTRKQLEGGDSAAGSYSANASSLGYYPSAGMTASTFGNVEMYIPNYTSSNYKSISIDSVGEGNQAGGVYSDLFAELWSNTAAITSITLATGNNFAEFTTVSLYGISSSTSTQNTSIPFATGGDVITTDGTYWYHAFIASGTFTPLKALTADCLVVAGGGGGSATNGAGGGAGGIFYATSQSFPSGTGVTATVGGGGTGGTSAADSFGTSGSNSTFGSLTAASGGGYGAKSGQGATGGSGGGSYNAAGGTSNQGSTGGTGYGNAGGVSTSNPASGGGGAGAAGGVNISPNTGGAGGAGTNTYSTWASATVTGASGYYGGGGGSGADYRNGTAVAGVGGSGGGGAGTVNGSNGVAGTTNTGGGGGSPGYSGAVWNGGAGGSGIVIVRYAVA